jgi:hypothetical protein
MSEEWKQFLLQVAAVRGGDEAPETYRQAVEGLAEMQGGAPSISVPLRSLHKVSVPYGGTMVVGVEEDREPPAGCAWVDSYDEDLNVENGILVNRSLVQKDSRRAIQVVGLHQPQATIEKGEPIAVLRVPTWQELRSYELVEEAIKEGKRGLQAHQQRRAKQISAQQSQAAGFRRPAESPGPKVLRPRLPPGVCSP